MAIKINQYPLERLTFGDDDYYDIDYWNGSAFETAKIKGSTIKAGILAGILSFYTANSSLTTDREVSGSGTRSLSFGLNTASNNLVNFNINSVYGTEKYSSAFPFSVIGTTIDKSNTGIIAEVRKNATEFSKITHANQNINFKVEDGIYDNQITVNDVLCQLYANIGGATPRQNKLDITGSSMSMISTKGSENFNFTFNSFTLSAGFNDGRTITKGLEYLADYSAGFQQHTLVDKLYVDTAISGVTGTNLFTANLNLLANRDHTLNDKIFKATFNDPANTVTGNWQISGNAITSYLNDTVSLGNLTTFRQDKDTFILTVDGGVTPTVFSIQRGICALANNNFGFSFNSNTKIATIGSTNGNFSLGDPSNNTNSYYRDLSTNKYGMLYKNFGETSETDATGANYSTLVGTSLVPKKYVDDSIADSIPSLTKTLTIQEPEVGDDITVFRTNVAITVQGLIAVSIGTGTPTTEYSVKYSSDRSATGTTLVATTTTTSLTTGDSATLTNTQIPANSFIWVEISSASGTDVYLSLDLRYTED